MNKMNNKNSTALIYSGAIFVYTHHSKYPKLKGVEINLFYVLIKKNLGTHVKLLIYRHKD